MKELTINSTTDYGQFKLMKGNRVVDYNHVRRLKREMEENPEMVAASPILVNESLFVVDGQHRLQAALELKVPIFYIVSEGATIEATRHLNITQRRWKLLDFAQSYADSGRTDYLTFLRVYAKYPNLAPGIVRTYLAGSSKTGLESDFRRGDFKVDDVEAATRNLDRLDMVRRKARLQINSPMANAFLALFTEKVKGVEGFDFDLFMEKLERETAQELLKPVPSIRGCLRSIEDVYNFQSKSQKRLY